MPSRSRQALKSLLLALGTGLLPFAVERSLQGQPLAAGIGVVIGVLALVAYVGLDDLDKVLSADRPGGDDS